MRNWLRRKLNWVLYLGHGEHLTLAEAKQVRLTNGFCLFLLAMGLTVSFYFPLAEYLREGNIGHTWVISVADLFMTSLILVSLRYNHLQRHRAAKYFLITILNLWFIVFIVLWGQDTHFEYYFLLLLVFPLMLFDHKPDIVLFGVVSCCLFILSHVIFHYFKPLLYTHPNVVFQRFVVDSIALFAVQFWMVYYFKASNHRNEKALQEEQLKLRQALDELRQARDRMEDLSNTDPLTGLANRKRLEELQAREIDRSQRYGQSPLSIILFDLDHFKNINDAFGHAAGDHVLVEVSKVAARSIRKVDLIGRWGGEEFLIICPQTDLEQALTLAERIRLALGRHETEGVGAVTSSFGVANLREGDTQATLFERADRALYHSKQNGRDQVNAA